MGRGEEKDQSHWSEDRVYAVLVVVGIACLLTGAGAGWGLRQGDVDYYQDIASVWEDRTHDQIEKAEYWMHEAQGYDNAITELADRIAYLATNHTLTAIDYELQLANAELRFYRMEEMQQVLQEENVRLKLAYQDLWDVWWNATH